MATRALYYKEGPDIEPRKIATVTFERGKVTIDTSDRLVRSMLEPIMSYDHGKVTPEDGKRYWDALAKAFATSSYYYVA